MTGAVAGGEPPAEHRPLITGGRDGKWLPYCEACSEAEQDYVYPCRQPMPESRRAHEFWPPGALVAAASGPITVPHEMFPFCCKQPAESEIHGRAPQAAGGEPSACPKCEALRASYQHKADDLAAETRRVSRLLAAVREIEARFESLSRRQSDYAGPSYLAPAFQTTNWQAAFMDLAKVAEAMLPTVLAAIEDPS